MGYTSLKGFKLFQSVMNIHTYTTTQYLPLFTFSKEEASGSNANLDLQGKQERPMVFMNTFSVVDK